MVRIIAPLNDAAFSEAGWRSFVGPLASSGVLGSPGGTECQVYANASGMQVFLRAGSALLVGTGYTEPAQLTFTVPANGAGSARTDLMVLRLDPAASPTINRVVPLLVAGTPGAGAPAVTRTSAGVWELPLARVAVAAGAVNIAAAAVTDVREFAGVDVAPMAAGRRPTGPRVGQLVYDAGWYGWDGSAWQQLPTLAGVVGGWTPLTPAGSLTSNGGAAPLACRAEAGRVHVRGELRKSDSSAFTALDVAPGVLMTTLPGGFRPADRTRVPIAGTLTGGLVGARAEITPNGEIRVDAPAAYQPTFLTLDNVHFPI